MSGYSDMAIEVAKAKAAADPTEENTENVENITEAYEESGPTPDPIAAVQQDESFEEKHYVENSDEGVANAKPGDWIKTSKGEKQITQKDIDWAKKKIGGTSGADDLTEVPEEPEVPEVPEEPNRPFEDMTDDALYNLYSEMKKKGNVDPEIEAEMNRRFNPEGEDVNENVKLDQKTLDKGASPEGQESAVETFVNETGKVPNGHKPEETVNALNDYGGLVTAKQVTDVDENGKETKRWEFTANIKSKAEWEKERGKAWKPWLLAGLTLASVVGSVISAYASDGQFILPPIDFGVFDPDAVEYDNIMGTAKDLAKSLNDAQTKGIEKTFERRATGENAETNITGAQTEGKAQAAEDTEVLKAKAAFEKDMASYKQTLEKNMHKFDNDLRIEADKAYKENDVSKMIDIAKRVGGDSNILDKLSSASQANSGMYNLSPAQTANIVMGFFGQLFKLIPSDRNVKTFVKNNGASDILGGLL